MLAPTASPKQAKSRRQGPSGLTQALVREFLDYDSDTGFLTWRARNLSWFKCERDWKIWNTRYAGQRAGAWDSCYTRVSIFNKRYLTHRIIFLWMLSRWPNSQIDHIDHDPNNNR